MTPYDYYNSQIEKGYIAADPVQIEVLQHLQTLYQELTQETKRRKSLLNIFNRRDEIKGLYIWGSVGIGKTFLMDCFYNTLPFPQKLRLHFHKFMQRIHYELTALQGKKDPLKLIAKQLAKENVVICFDELFVSDITDAMLLGRLFKALFAEGVTLVATSNAPPDDLYKNGLQRSQFLPAIAQLKNYTTILYMPSSTDYRMRHLREAGVFYTPITEENNQLMEKTFQTLTNNQDISTQPITINDREINIKKRSNDTVWFEFTDICSVPRSQMDYLEIAKRFKTVFISNVPIIQAQEKDKICLFISLIDVLYDARVRVVMSAAEPVDQLYNRGYMIMEYTRTHSRLLEMQSEDYFISELDQNDQQ